LFSPPSLPPIYPSLFLPPPSFPFPSGFENPPVPWIKLTFAPAFAGSVPPLPAFPPFFFPTPDLRLSFSGIVPLGVSYPLRSLFPREAQICPTTLCNQVLSPSAFLHTVVSPPPFLFCPDPEEGCLNGPQCSLLAFSGPTLMSSMVATSLPSVPSQRAVFFPSAPLSHSFYPQLRLRTPTGVSRQANGKPSLAKVVLFSLLFPAHEDVLILHLSFPSQPALPG